MHCNCVALWQPAVEDGSFFLVPFIYFLSYYVWIQRFRLRLQAHFDTNFSLSICFGSFCRHKLAGYMCAPFRVSFSIRFVWLSPPWLVKHIHLSEWISSIYFYCYILFVYQNDICVLDAHVRDLAVVRLCGRWFFMAFTKKNLRKTTFLPISNYQ